MAVKIVMSQAMDLYYRDRLAEGASPATLRNHRDCLRRFHRTTGDLLVSSVTRQHVSTYLAGLTPGPGVGNQVSILKTFFRWCQANGYVKDSPAADRRRPKTMPPQKRRLPSDLFPALLDAAEEHDPRDRIVVALGAYLFLRAGELRDLRIQDVDLADGFLTVRVFKTRQVDQMPVCLELDQELRKWLRSYTDKAQAPLKGDWHLIPGYIPRIVIEDGKRKSLRLLKPEAAISEPEEVVQRALKGIGWEVDGHREGMHTLRRSGARALFDHLVEQSYDGALRRVQAMLHHSDSKMTERYLGIEIDRHQRNELIRGVEMFPVRGVTRLRASG